MIYKFFLSSYYRSYILDLDIWEVIYKKLFFLFYFCQILSLLLVAHSKSVYLGRNFFTISYMESLS